MKVVKKVMFLLIISLLVISFICQTNIFAYDMMSDINTLAGNGDTTNTTASVTNIAQSVVTITRVICAGVAVIMIMVLAMKYMYAAPSEKADVKKHAIPYVVGAVIMFAASGILTILQDFAGIFD